MALEIGKEGDRLQGSQSAIDMSDKLNRTYHLVCKIHLGIELMVSEPMRHSTATNLKGSRIAMHGPEIGGDNERELLSSELST